MRVDDTLVLTLSDEIERVMMLDVNPHRANAKTVGLDAKGQEIIIETTAISSISSRRSRLMRQHAGRS